MIAVRGRNGACGFQCDKSVIFFFLLWHWHNLFGTGNMLWDCFWNALIIVTSHGTDNPTGKFPNVLEAFCVSWTLTWLPSINGLRLELDVSQSASPVLFKKNFLFVTRTLTEFSMERIVGQTWEGRRSMACWIGQLSRGAGPETPFVTDCACFHSSAVLFQRSSSILRHSMVPLATHCLPQSCC